MSNGSTDLDFFSDAIHAARCHLCHSTYCWNFTGLLCQSLRIARKNSAICRADVWKNDRRAGRPVLDPVVFVSVTPGALMHEHGWNAEHADITV